MKTSSQLFAYYNQRAKELYYYACGIFSCAINLYFNTGILVSMEFIDKTVKGAIEKKILNPVKGGGITALGNYFLERVRESYNPNIQYTEFDKNSKKFPDYLNQGYMIRLGVKVSKGFTVDSEDNGQIDITDYAKHSGMIGHITNGFKGVGRFKGGDSNDRHIIYDSYADFKKYNMFYVDFKEMKETVMMNTCSMFYLP